MKRKAAFFVILLAGIILAGSFFNRNGTVMNGFLPRALFTSQFPATTDTAAWKKVDSLIDKGLTESALKELEPLLRRSRKSGNTTQIVRSLLYRMRLESYKEEGSIVKAINLLEKEIASAKDGLKAILHSITAEVYWRYYQENRWRVYDRTNIIDFKQDDITTWDMTKIVGMTLFHYDRSIDDKKLLQTAGLEQYRDLLLATGSLDKRRPTLYDLLAHRAIDLFMNSEIDLPQPAFLFQLDKEEYFSRYQEFTSLRLTTRDSLSFKFRALKILQELIAFHKGDADREALIDADLKRLDFVRRYSTLEHKDSLYLRSLEWLEDRCSGKPIAAEVGYQIARWYAQKGNEYEPGKSDRYKWFRKKAVDICNGAAKKHPESYGACQCKALRDELVAKYIAVEIEEVSLPGKPLCVLLSWKNITQAWFRAVAIDEKEYKKLRETIGYQDQEKLVRHLCALKPAAEWNTPIPDDGDFQTHCAEVNSPALPSGYYLLVAGANAGFVYPGNGVAVTHFRLSRIAYFGRTINNDYELFLRDRETGSPLAGAMVKKIERVYNRKTREHDDVVKGTFTADREGRVVLPSPFSVKNRYANPFRIEIEHGDDRLTGDREFYHYRQSTSSDSRIQTFFFTDRSIYRPGQTVYFKGIVLRRKGDSSAVVTRHSTTVEFRDVNYKVVASRKLTTNDYGTVSGNFLAPQGVVNGQMSIQDQGGSISFSVEEYKRPAFEVESDPVKGAYRLDETVKVTGRAKTFAGSPVDGAQVKYRVVRNTSYPSWRGWWGLWFPSSPEMEIVHGSTATNDTGGYAVSFKAVPDRSVSRSHSPVFTYTVFIDIVDKNGETRSAQQSVAAGYTALTLAIETPRNVEKESDSAFSIVATNLNGVPEPVKGSVKVFRLKAPEIPFRARLWREPDKFLMNKREYRHFFPGIPYAGEDKIDGWQKEEEVLQKTFDTKTDSMLVIKEIKKWPQGMYAVEALAKDPFGREVKNVGYFTLCSGAERALPYPVADWCTVVKGTGEPGEKAVFLIGSGEKEVPVLFEIEHQNTIEKKEWLLLSKGQKRIEVPIEEKHRGNFGVHFSWVKNGRCYRHDELITVPWTSKELSFSFETFRDKLQPGQKEEWKIKITGSKKDKVAAEMVAAMYDASLDAFRPHAWYFAINSLRGMALGWDMGRQFGSLQTDVFSEGWNRSSSCAEPSYPCLNWFGYEGGSWQGGIGYAGAGRPLSKSLAMEAPMSAQAEEMSVPASPPPARKAKAGVMGLLGGDASDENAARAPSPETKRDKGNGSPKPAVLPDLSTIKARANLNETAFFFPALTTNDKGEIVLPFTMPEALTRWKLLGFAHTRDLKYGSLSREVTTRKPLMVMPNLPRFLRENDTITLLTKIANMSDSSLAGSARLMLFDATTMKPVDSAMGNRESEKKFVVSKGLSAAVAWTISVPRGIPAVAVRMVAAAGSFTDGEERTLPLLVNRKLVTEAMPLPIRGKGVKEFAFTKLLSQGNGSSTLRNHKLTLEFTQNPAWYAVQALPYLMEFPYECAEQTFGRYYANAIATHVANAAPKIKAVFDAWKRSSPEGLLSNLEKNQELKNALLEETPWVLDGASESEAKKRIGLLFDLNRMSGERSVAHRRLAKMQMRNGGWPWFDGMPEDRYITQYIVTGFGKLKKLKMVDFSKDSDLKSMVERAVQYTDERIREDYEYTLKHAMHPDSNNLGPLQIYYLYGRTFWKEIALADRNKKAFDYYLKQASHYWQRNNRYQQGMIALALNRKGVDGIPRDIIKSLRENALESEEMGMYWKEMYEGYYWYEAPIEAQALYIEAFDEVSRDSVAVEAMKVWLLKSKQTQNWQTTRATAEACYALLLRGADLLAKGNDVTVTLGKLVVDPKKTKDLKVESGTGYFKTSWSGGEIKPEMGKVKVTKEQSGVAWGALYWQYFEQLDKITAAATPIKLSKKLFTKRTGDRGPVLEPVEEKGNLKVGDRVTVRIELRVDRDLEYVHMKDLRAAGFEPVNVFSGYRWQDGLGYYESTRDAAAYFFFGSLKKGTHVFEYDLLVSHRGNFSNGITSIQCMYAPEFASHSEGIRVKVGG
jgi:hypothetical protein